MIERDGLPIALRMAGLAFLSVRSFVFVDFHVTCVTIERRIFERGSQVTFLALDLGMLTHQWETRLVMVEGCLFPGPVVVTFLALRALLSFMLVVFLMAGVTVHRGFLITVVFMAALARDFHMLVPKLVASLVVIEPDIFPILIRVTVRACATDLPFVLIVFLVAGVTV